MDSTLSMFLAGLQLACQPENLLAVAVGCIVGTMIGVLPGVGPVSAVALLVPLSFGLPPATALIMMAGVYYGAMYGGSTTSILLNAPGESASVVTCIDGHKLALKGRAGSALGVAAIGSFIAGTLGVIVLMFLAPPLSQLAIAFQPPEYFALMVLALVASTSLGEGSLVKALISMCVGLAIGTIGQDVQTGTLRFTFGSSELVDGIDFLVAALGLFALSEVLSESVEPHALAKRIPFKSPYPTWQDLKRSFGAMLRGSGLGIFFGLLPGAGLITSPFVSYSVEKQLSKHPEEFGEGAIEGVAGPESANNGAAAAGFVPLLTLGLPGSATMALLLGIFMMWGIQPGPLLIPQHPEMFWSLVASMYVGNVMLLILNLPMVPLFAKIIDIPKPLLLPMILVFAFIGVYSVNSSTFDLWLVLAFGVMGFLMRLYRFPAAPLVMSLVLGPLMEKALRQGLTMSNGNPLIFFERPIALGVFILAAIFLCIPLVKARRRAKAAAAG
ncbi:tripartite tricarboxylate transporter permease [Sporolituus thermophilus]|uniref:Putative tricarboxylic transport membrane protein n=1 Tax=Sporolituus thermophilus DSM 23256 TaxID=1123285 RepID=A0A1G7L8T4_9FIRM|nr:tripartite tricarboxylate transporter permease [Sporolituus thermophilus]SDF45786.1 putative tricarboxylic transport membrane protein [Sporolituus thermophilus DSM 23256]